MRASSSKEDKVARADLTSLGDIQEACAHILNRLEGVSLAKFADDRTLRDSINMQLAYIGEASKSLSDKAKKMYPAIAWRDMARLRDLLVQRSWHAEVMKLWEIVQSDIPVLYSTLQGE